MGSSSVTPSADGCVVNVVSNPAATNPTDWSAYGGAGGAASGAIDAVPVSGFPAATSYLTSWSAASTDGKGGVFYVNTPAVADVVYTISMFAQSSIARDLALRIDMKDSTGAGVASVSSNRVSVAAGGVARLSRTVTTLAGTAKLTISLQGAGDVNWNPGDKLHTTGLMITQGSTLYNYADGNSPGWSWTGTPNASTSFGPPL